jgi:hypothetical protein
MTDFLSATMPEVRKSLPDWQAVKRGDASAVSGGVVPDTNARQQ